MLTMLHVGSDICVHSLLIYGVVFCSTEMSMDLKSTQLITKTTVRSLQYMATCFDPHLSHLHANI